MFGSFLKLRPSRRNEKSWANLHQGLKMLKHHQNFEIREEWIGDEGRNILLVKQPQKVSKLLTKVR